MRVPAFAALTAAAVLCTPAARAAENDATVATYHADAARSGHYVFPGLTWANAGEMRRDEAFDGRVPGHVYAQPLYWRPPGSERGDGPRHLVFGLSLADGKVLPGWPVDIADSLRALGMTFNAPAQGERGALTLAGDRLYVPYGGHFGECGDYHGWVVGLHLDKPTVFAAWRTPARMAGIWAPGEIAFDGIHLFAAAGHTGDTAEQWNGANAVIRLPLDLRWHPITEDFFAPADWHQLNYTYLVLAYNNPLAFDLPDGGPGAALLFVLDKLGNAYLLDRANLGGIGHPLLVQNVADAPVNTSPAAWRMGHDMIVTFQANSSPCPGDAGEGGLLVLRISGGAQPATQKAWCAKLSGRGATIVTTSDDTADPIVWIVDAEGDEKLHGFRGDTGQPIFTSDPLEGLRHYVTILAAAGRLYVAGDGRIFAFGLAH